MRQREKGREYWVVESRNRSGSLVAATERKTRAEASTLKGELVAFAATQGVELTVCVVHVARYRLAPLVVLPAWDRIGSEWSVAKNADEYAARIEVDQDPEDEESVAFEVFVYDEHGGTPDENVVLLESPTLEDAKKWAEARLRELGYRVAKPKAGT